MLLKKFLIAAIISLLANFCYAAYIVHNVEGNVLLEKKTEKIPVTKDMELNANDMLVIGENSKIEIYNSNTKEIYTSTEPGKLTAMSVMLNAQKSSSSELKNITSQIKLSPGDRSNTRQYTEGSVKRAIDVYGTDCDSVAQCAAADSIPATTDLQN